MSRIHADITSTKITDYYPMTSAQEVDEIAPAQQEAAKTGSNLLHRQMQDTLQNFHGFMSGLNDATRGEQLSKSLAGAETVKKGLGDYASKPDINMNTLMLEMNQLLSKLRDLQRDHALQQQVQALKMQEHAYDKEKNSIAHSQQAAQKGAIFGGIGAGVGLLGSGMKVKGAISKGSAESKQFTVNELMRNEGKSEEEAFSIVNQKTSNSHWQKVKNSKKNPTNWGSSPNSMETVTAKINRNNKYGSSGDLLGQAPTLLTPIAQAAAMGDNSESSRLKVNADFDKGIQHINEREQGIQDEQARAASQQMRDVQQQMNELYSKIATAVRW
jgi:hypothetical protein